MRKKVFITGGLLALMLILSSGTAYAAGLQLSPDEVATIRTEIQSGKPIKDVLEEHHITMGQIRGVLQGGLESNGHKLSNTQIASIATKLGLDATAIQAEIASGKSLQQILKDHSITEDQLKAAFGAKKPLAIAGKTSGKKKPLHKKNAVPKTALPAAS